MRASHSHFFSSLNQLEKRLRLDDKKSTQSFISSPLYLDEIDSVGGNASETPLQFLSESPLGQQTQVEEERVEGNEVEVLMQLLGLSDHDNAVEVDFGCDHTFYGSIVGVKGPKCKKEVERLEGWIRNISRERRRSEPLRLAHLLLGKAAFLHSNVEFPSTVDDFLHNDPPIE